MFSLFICGECGAGWRPLGRDRTILGPDRRPPRTLIMLSGRSQRGVPLQGWRAQTCLYSAASAVQSSTVHSFPEPPSFGCRKQMHALATLAKCCFQVLATKAGMGRAHQQVHGKCAHAGAWSGGASSRLAAVTGGCAHCVIDDHFPQSHQGETCCPRHLLLGWGADPERVNLQGRYDTKGQFD